MSQQKEYLINRYRQALQAKLASLPNSLSPEEKEKALAEWLMRLVQQDEAALHRTIGRKQYELDKSKLNLLFDVRKELDDQRARQIVGSLLS